MSGKQATSGNRTTAVAGIGCRSNAPLADVLAVIDAALELHGLARDDVSAVATVPLKRDEPAIATAAEALGAPLVIVSNADARQASGRCLTSSAASLTAAGVACVSEAAALAAAGADGRLAHPRVVCGAATCALAITAPAVREPRP